MEIPRFDNLGPNRSTPIGAFGLSERFIYP